MTLENSKKKRVSSGIAQLDNLLGDLYIGDNVLWYEDAGSFCSAFCVNFIRESLANKKPIIYVSFDRSPKNVVTFLGPLAENQNFTILDCFTNGKGDKSEVFNKIYEKDGAQWPHQIIKVNEPTNPSQVSEAIYGVHGHLSGDIRFIIDSLTGMQDLWGGEEQVLKFYVRTCPRLYELETIAYWIIEKSAHSNRLKANINKIAQVAIDLSVKNGRPSLKILKAEKRNSKFLNEPHTYSCEDTDINFDLQRNLPDRFDLGTIIKNFRKKQGLSQKELAEKTGVTPSSISQVEKNLIYPSLPALFRIAESLSVDVSTFFADFSKLSQNVLHRGIDGVKATFDHLPKDAIEGELLLPPDMDAAVAPYRIRILPGRKLSRHFFNHKGEEFGYLLSGKLTVRIKNQSHELGVGDIVYLRKDTPDQWENTSDTPAEVLWITLK